MTYLRNLFVADKDLIFFTGQENVFMLKIKQKMEVNTKKRFCVDNEMCLVITR